jgi:hypothetical protein
MEAVLEGLRSYGKRTTACQISSVACPHESKSDSDVMGAAVDAYKEVLDKMETSGATEAILERQELNVDTVGSLEDQHVDRHLIVRCHRQPRKWIQDMSQYKNWSSGGHSLSSVRSG